VQDHEPSAPIALTCFHPKSARDLKAQELFQREGNVLRLLRHLGVPEVYETGSVEVGGRASLDADNCAGSSSGTAPTTTLTA